MKEIKWGGGEALKKEWEKMGKKVKKAVKEIEIEMGGIREKKRGWWNEECE